MTPRGDCATRRCDCTTPRCHRADPDANRERLRGLTARETPTERALPICARFLCFWHSNQIRDVGSSSPQSLTAVRCIFLPVSSFLEPELPAPWPAPAAQLLRESIGENSGTQSNAPSG